MTRLMIAVALAFWFLAGLAVPDISLAMERPTKEEIVKYKQDGTFAQRLERARQIGNDKTDPYILWKTQRKVNSLVLKEKGISSEDIADQMVTNAPPPAMKGLPTTGTVKIPMLLVDFPDYPHAAGQTVEDVSSKLFGSGNQADYPYESMQKYYQRSSYNQLTITGNVLGWYRAQYSRSYYENLGDGSGQDVLIKEALNYFNNQGHDFAQYDNDNDGTIDGVFIKWTGPDNGWSGFWWAYQYYFFDSSYSVDGKRLSKYVWSWYSREYTGGYDYDYRGAYSPKTDIHETGHMLGLPDYYDYDDRYGPDGGVGSLDMMDGNWGDHNCFSKFMLDWLTPTVIASGEQSKNFSPSGASRDAALIMTQAGGNVFNEYFMVQYRKRSTGNDPSDYPADGLLIWHVDATLNSSGNDFEYDNSYAGHKLLALEQADGLGEIEYGAEADQGDFFLPPKTFGPDTNPNSNRYSGSSTDVRVDNLGAPGAGMTARLAVGGQGQVTAVALAADRTSPQPAGTTVTFTATASGAGSPEYQFWYQNPAGQWASSGDYSANNTFQLNNPVTGTYTVVAYARANSNQDAVASNVVQFTFNPGQGGTGITVGINVRGTGGPAYVSLNSQGYQSWQQVPGGGSYGYTGLAPGTYTLAIFADKYPAKVIPVIVSSGQMVAVNATLVPGDTDGNGRIDITDVRTIMNFWDAGASPDTARSVLRALGQQ